MDEEENQNTQGGIMTDTPRHTADTPQTIEEIVREFEEYLLNETTLASSINGDYYKKDEKKLKQFIKHAYLAGAHAHAESMKLDKTEEELLLAFDKYGSFHSSVMKSEIIQKIEEQTKRSEEFLKTLNHEKEEK